MSEFITAPTKAATLSKTTASILDYVPLLGGKPLGNMTGVEMERMGALLMEAARVKKMQEETRRSALEDTFATFLAACWPDLRHSEGNEVDGNALAEDLARLMCQDEEEG